MHPIDRFTLKDIERLFGAQTILKGRGYLSNVSNLEMHKNGITAEVQGTELYPYSVEIWFIANRAGVWNMGNACSCPLGGNCKHVVAVLLSAIKDTSGTDQINNQVLEWIAALRQSSKAASRIKSAAAIKNSPKIFYQLEWSSSQRDCRVTFLKSRVADTGLPARSAEQWNNVERALTQPPQFVDEADLAIMRLLWAQRGRDSGFMGYVLAGRHGSDIMQRMLATGRLLSNDRLLVAGEPRPANILWKLNNQGKLVPVMATTPASSMVIPLDPCWYVDGVKCEAGLAETDISPVLLNQLAAMPPLTEKEIPLVVTVLSEVAPRLPLPSAASSAGLRVIDEAPRAILQLDSQQVYNIRYHRGYTLGGEYFDYALPGFHYGEVQVPLNNDREFFSLPSGETVRVKRQMETEARLLKSLVPAGLEKVAPHLLHSFKPLPDGVYGLASEAAWDHFMDVGVGALKSAGWEIRFAPEFRHHVLEVEDWQAEIDENENGWFDLDMGIVVEGQRLPLAPLLSNLFKWDARWLDSGQIALMPDSEFIELQTQDGKRIRVTAGRLKPIATTLIDLFDTIPMGKLRVAKLDAPRLAELADMQRWQFKGMAAVQELAQRLRDSQGMLLVDPPKSFAGELRDYQREGLAWLQYLRTHELSGILADDMGLGKTAQAIAHLQLEKEGGRLDRPALIVLPTSLVFNWKNEAARFAPELSILSLHGVARKALFTEIPKHDVVLTTYPLLWRDADELAKYEYHLLILDEAQMVKNAQSKGAAVVRKINTRHRLCLTGTPLENHLGELWAQFDFLMPGFLADSKSFTKTWRTPIEKQGNQLRRELLYKRLKPFILRRRKEDVAKELPSKSIIVRPVELEGMQRDLYETVRSAMDDKVRQEIAAKGFKRSQIVILDALLKLRQVCCDPRLLKTRQDKKSIGSAKLALLMDMLPELVDEGRRILVFSQFTRMLALIEAELDRLKIPYLLLTGDTDDRETPVRRFQAGEVPVFLISLKAGGVGLNLTAADTVIHYDPWWNPAVENQATDRAHRIGQDKPVFVYKLIVAGSIEERILLMQEKKALLAESVLSKDQGIDFKFGEDDLAALLAPLPD